MAKLNLEQRLQKAVVDITANDTFRWTAGVLMLGKSIVVEADHRHQTAATNGLDVWYNRKFCDNLTDAELRFVVLHECYHKMFRHLTTWAHLWKQNAKVTNYACDYVINYDLVTAGAGFLNMPEQGLYDPRFAGMDSAKVFYILLDEQDELEQDEDEHGGGFDDHLWEEAQAMDAETREKIAIEVDAAVRQGQLLQKRVGAGTGNIAGAIGELTTPQVDWREALRAFVAQSCQGSEYSTWARPNRRYATSGYYLPSGIAHSLRDIVVAPDESGSIGIRERTAFLSEVVGIVEMVRPERLHLMYWDTTVTSHETHACDQLVSVGEVTQPFGGGGTDPACVPEYMRHERIEAQCAIVFTDGYVNSWGEWDVPVLWVIVDNKRANPTNGTVLHITSSQLN
jgi:predicted metal-dependent peptidase